MAPVYIIANQRKQHVRIAIFVHLEIFGEFPDLPKANLLHADGANGVNGGSVFAEQQQQKPLPSSWFSFLLRGLYSEGKESENQSVPGQGGVPLKTCSA